MMNRAEIEGCLDSCGSAVLSRLLTFEECKVLASLYSRDDIYRSRVVMARHGFGRGEYKYFSYPLPVPVQELRDAMYPQLVPIANRWNEEMRIDIRYPPTHREFIRRCHDAGQTRPTPLILEYKAGDYNCLHQDLYGEHVFPIQATVLLSRPGLDFEGGEFVMTQTGTQEKRAEVISLQQGDAVLFAVNQRPIKGKTLPVRVSMRHGVSRVRSGMRHTAGIIFHDAR
jgi:hypothetical protein